MAIQFVPLVPSAKPASPLPRPGLASENAARPESTFAPIAANPAATPIAHSPTQAHPTPTLAHSAPELSFKREGDRITQIQIRCACGQSMVLDCNYGADLQS